MKMIINRYRIYVRLFKISKKLISLGLFYEYIYNFSKTIFCFDIITLKLCILFLRIFFGVRNVRGMRN